MLPWIQLTIAGLLEVGWAIGLKYSQGFTRPLATVVTIVTMIASFWLLARAARTLPLGTAYAVWTGIGVLGTTILGIVLFNEPRNAPRLLFMFLILLGIVGLRCQVQAHEAA
ncbi:MAG: Quaternary ammonium compound-resistance protein SugE [Phycisphaerae bacterium]|nr:Quaternary ammonium compound-resistance protein SugE [Phycisphaerae bacterium]